MSIRAYEVTALDQAKSDAMASDAVASDAVASEAVVCSAVCSAPPYTTKHPARFSLKLSVTQFRQAKSTPIVPHGTLMYRTFFGKVEFSASLRGDVMGKGDKRSRRGKIANGSYGKTRKKKKKKKPYRRA